MGDVTKWITRAKEEFGFEEAGALNVEALEFMLACEMEKRRAA